MNELFPELKSIEKERDRAVKQNHKTFCISGSSRDLSDLFFEGSIQSTVYSRGVRTFLQEMRI